MHIYIDRMQENTAAKDLKKEMKLLGYGFQNIVANLARKNRAKTVLDQRSNYSDAIIGKHGGHQRSSMHEDGQIGAQPSFSDKLSPIYYIDP